METKTKELNEKESRASIATAINPEKRLEQIILMAKDRASKILEGSKLQEDYEPAKKILNRDFKAIQWYAIQRNNFPKNQSYIDYSIGAMDLMDELYDKTHKGAA